MILAFKFILLVLSTLVGYTLGYFFTETKYRLAQWDLFKFQAFECRPCLSFHITWVITTLIAAIFGDWVVFIIGIFFAFMLFIGLKIDQRNKTVKI